MESVSDYELLYMIHQGSLLSYEQLFIRYERMLWKLIYKHQLDSNEYREDALSLCFMGFQQAVECFQEKKGTCFSTYLHLVISTHLSNYYRKTLKQKARFCNYEYLDDEEIYKLDILMYHNDSLAQKVQDCQRMLHLVYEEFSDEEQLIFGLYLRGYNQKEITSSLHISKYHIQYMLDKFKKKCLEISENKAFD